VKKQQKEDFVGSKFKKKLRTQFFLAFYKEIVFTRNYRAVLHFLPYFVGSIISKKLQKLGVYHHKKKIVKSRMKKKAL
jgi:hypothetical protein